MTGILKTKAFTLIELVMVIVIIGILAIAAIPKMLDVKQKAINRSEQATMGALKAAINVKRMENTISGLPGPAGNYWPGQTQDDNPLDLLQNRPNGWQTQYNANGFGEWNLWCPCLTTHASGWVQPNVPFYNEWIYYPMGIPGVFPAGTFLPNSGSWHTHSSVEEMKT